MARRRLCGPGERGLRVYVLLTAILQVREELSQEFLVPRKFVTQGTPHA
jgi:hypothetical protein